jgi:hypothetical protein
MCTSSTTQQCACGPRKMLFEEHEWSGRDVTQDVARGASLDWQGKDLISLTSYIKYKWRINHLSTCHVNEAHIQRIVIAVSTTTPIRIVGDDFWQKPRRWEQARPRHYDCCDVFPAPAHNIRTFVLAVSYDESAS